MKRYYMRVLSALTAVIVAAFCLGLSGCSRTAAITVSITYNAVIGITENGEVKITENSDCGGIIIGRNVQTVTAGGRAEAVTAKAQPGYVFLGWSDGRTEERRRDTVFESTSVYAVFGRLYSSVSVITIDTQNTEMVNTDEKYIKCSVSVENCDKEYALSGMSAGIRLRGNSTMKYIKKPYRLKFDTPVQPLGLGGGAAKNWVLLAEYSDSSYLRNYFTYFLAGQMQNITYCTDCTFVELYLNNEYKGLYLLAEQNEVGETRVNIDTAGEDDPAVTDTGYLLELEASEARRLAEGVPNLDWIAVPGYAINRDTAYQHSQGSDVAFYVIKSDAKSREQAGYIKAYMKDVYDAIYKNEGAVKVGNAQYLCGTKAAVEALVDIDSAVDMYILQLLANDYDNNFSSAYVYKDAGGKLVFSVPWDYDLAYGNYKGHTEADSVYMFHLLKDLERFDWFREAAYMRFLQLTGEEGLIPAAIAAADALSAEAAPVFARDAQLYGTGDRDETWGIGAPSQADAYETLKGWINARLEFMAGYLSDNAMRSDA
ncbi:MAG: CotH kinase family protein [Firmicutes bacterium]|nr:CotH kinase family protein [Bacillota bacterium]